PRFVPRVDHPYIRWVWSQFRVFVYPPDRAPAPVELTSPTPTLLTPATTSANRAESTDSTHEADLLRLLRLCSTDDLIIFPAAETLHLEMLLELLPRLEISAPLPTTLHMRFTGTPRLLVGRGELDTETIAPRLASG